MNKPIVSEDEISSDTKTPEEKSKKRAAELKASAARTKKSKSVSAESEKKHVPSAQEQEAIEASIVDELNRTIAIVHTSSTYILIEKDEIEFVLDSKTSLLILYENQVVPELSSNNIKKITKAQIWLRSLIAVL